MSAFPGSTLVWVRLAFTGCLGLSALVLFLLLGSGGMAWLIMAAGVLCLSLGWIAFETQIIAPLQGLAQVSGDPVQTLGARISRLEEARNTADAKAKALSERPAEIDATGTVPRDEVLKMLDVLAAGGTPSSTAELQSGLDEFMQRVEAFRSSLGCLTLMAKNPLSDTRMPPEPGWFGACGSEVNAAMELMADRYVERTQAASRVAGVSTQIREGAEAFSARIEAQAAALQQTAATMEQVSATVATNAESASAATKLSSSTAEIASRGRDVADKAVQGMRKIDDSARKISEITSLVDGIAFQTNLLSLNAAVEAARAGEAGKGFAVVASEVRTLAQRAADAARSISELVAESTIHVSEGVTQVEATGSLLVEIQAGIEKVVHSISEISSATREQAAGIGEISQTLSNLDDETQSNAALVTRTIADARQLGVLATTLGAQDAKGSGAVMAPDPEENALANAGEWASDYPDSGALHPPSHKNPDVKSYVPRPSHNLPEGRGGSATALAVADEDGWEEF
ncbi:MAG: methyl-accepting chemotaxis protein [Pseudomonadota bacterium]